MWRDINYNQSSSSLKMDCRLNYNYRQQPMHTLHEYDIIAHSSNTPALQTLDNEKDFEGFIHLDCKYNKLPLYYKNSLKMCLKFDKLYLIHFLIE